MQDKYKQNISLVYGALKQGNFNDLGTEEEFAKAMSNAENRQIVFGALQQLGYTGVGKNVDEFSSMVYDGGKTTQQATQQATQQTQQQKAQQKPQQPQQQKPQQKPQQPQQKPQQPQQQKPQQKPQQPQQKPQQPQQQKPQQKPVEYFKLRRGGYDFTVSKDEVDIYGGLSGWAKHHPGAPLRVWMVAKDGKEHHVDLSVAHTKLKKDGYKYRTTLTKGNNAPTRYNGEMTKIEAPSLWAQYKASLNDLSSPEVTSERTERIKEERNRVAAHNKFADSFNRTQKREKMDNVIWDDRAVMARYNAERKAVNQDLYDQLKKDNRITIPEEIKNLDDFDSAMQNEEFASSVYDLSKELGLNTGSKDKAEFLRSHNGKGDTYLEYRKTHHADYNPHAILKREQNRMEDQTKKAEDEFYNREIKKHNDFYANDDDKKYNPTTSRRGLEVYFDFIHDPTYETFEATKEALDNSRKIIEEAENSRDDGQDFVGFMKGAYRGFKDGVFDINTWDFGITDSRNAMRLRSIIEKADRGEKLTDVEQGLLDAKALEGVTAQYYSVMIGRGYNAGNVTALSLPFMIEMCINPLSGAGKSIQSAFVRYIMKRFGSAATKSLWKKIALKVATKAATAAVRIGGDVLGATGMALTSGQARVQADAMNRQIGEIEGGFVNRGGITQVTYTGHKDGESSYGKAYLKALGAQTIENYSEMFGEYLTPVSSFANRGTAWLARKAGMGKMVDAVGRLTGSEAALAMDRFLAKTQWHGPIGEYLEEVAGNIMNALTVGDMTFDQKKAIKDGKPGSYVWDRDMNIDTFLGVALMSGHIALAKTPFYRGEHTAAVNSRNKAMSRLEISMAGNPMFIQIKKLVESTPINNLAPLTSQILGNSTMTQDQKRKALEYIKAQAHLAGVEQEIENRKKKREEGETPAQQTQQTQQEQETQQKPQPNINYEAGQRMSLDELSEASQVARRARMSLEERGYGETLSLIDNSIAQNDGRMTDPEVQQAINSVESQEDRESLQNYYDLQVRSTAAASVPRQEFNQKKQDLAVRFAPHADEDGLVDVVQFGNETYVVTDMSQNGTMLTVQSVNGVQSRVMSSTTFGMTRGQMSVDELANNLYGGELQQREAEVRQAIGVDENGNLTPENAAQQQAEQEQLAEAKEEQEKEEQTASNETHPTVDDTQATSENEQTATEEVQPTTEEVQPTTEETQPAIAEGQGAAVAENNSLDENGELVYTPGQTTPEHVRSYYETQLGQLPEGARAGAMEEEVSALQSELESLEKHEPQRGKYKSMRKYVEAYQKWEQKKAALQERINTTKQVADEMFPKAKEEVSQPAESSTEQTPTDNTQTTTEEAQQATTEGEQATTEGEQATTEGEQTTTEGEQTTTEGEQTTEEVQPTTEEEAQPTTEEAQPTTEEEQSTAEKLRQRLDGLESETLHLHVVENEEQISDQQTRKAVQDAIKEGSMPQAWVQTDENGHSHVYFYVPGLTGEEGERKIAQTILHEIVQHHGMKTILGDRFVSFMERVWENQMDAASRFRYSQYVWDHNYSTNTDRRSGVVEGAENKKWSQLTSEQRRQALNSSAFRSEVADEWCAAYLQQEGIKKQSLYRRLIYGLREFLRKHGFEIKFTDNELRSWWQKSQEAVVKDGEKFKAEDYETNNPLQDTSAGSVSEAIEDVDDAVRDSIEGTEEEKEQAVQEVREQLPVGTSVDGKTHAQFSMSSALRSAGLRIEQIDDDHVRITRPDGTPVERVTADDILESVSPMAVGMQMASQSMFFQDGFIKQMAENEAEMLNLAIQSARIEESDEFSIAAMDAIFKWVGSDNYHSIKPNADKQYKKSAELTTICKKVNAIASLLGLRMAELGRGVTPEEVIRMYEEVSENTEYQSPCPQCYVFSRWFAKGKILGTLNRLTQNYKRELSSVRRMSNTSANISYWYGEMIGSLGGVNVSENEIDAREEKATRKMNEENTDIINMQEDIKAYRDFLKKTAAERKEVIETYRNSIAQTEAEIEEIKEKGIDTDHLGRLENRLSVAKRMFAIYTGTREYYHYGNATKAMPFVLPTTKRALNKLEREMNKTFLENEERIESLGVGSWVKNVVFEGVRVAKSTDKKDQATAIQELKADGYLPVKDANGEQVYDKGNPVYAKIRPGHVERIESGKPLPGKDIIFDVMRSSELKREYGDFYRYIVTRGAGAGKAVETEADNPFGDTWRGMVSSNLNGAYERGSESPFSRIARIMQENGQSIRSLNRLYDVYKSEKGSKAKSGIVSKELENAFKQYENEFERGKAEAAKQLLKGGNRVFSWSDWRLRHGLDLVNVLFEMQMFGAGVQSYSKQLEGIEALSSMGAYVNGSLIGHNKGYLEVGNNEAEAKARAQELQDLVERDRNDENGEYHDVRYSTPVRVDEEVEVDGKVQKVEKWYVLSFNSRLGVDYEELLKLNEKHSHAGNITIGMSDKHCRILFAHPDIHMVIPWHSSGLSNHLLNLMLKHEGSRFNENESSDYTKVQEEKKMTDSMSYTPEAWERLVSAARRSAEKVGLDPDTYVDTYLSQNGMSEAQIKYRQALEYAATGSIKDASITNEEAQSLIDGDTYLKSIQETVQSKGIKMTPGDDLTVLPWMYWDKSLSADKAQQNMHRYVDFCLRQGLIPKFIGLVGNKQGAFKLEMHHGAPAEDFGNMEGSWNVLVDRRMYDLNNMYQDTHPLRLDGVHEGDQWDSNDVTGFQISQVDEKQVRAKHNVTAEFNPDDVENARRVYNQIKTNLRTLEDKQLERKAKRERKAAEQSEEVVHVGTATQFSMISDAADWLSAKFFGKTKKGETKIVDRSNMTTRELAEVAGLKAEELSDADKFGVPESVQIGYEYGGIKELYSNEDGHPISLYEAPSGKRFIISIAGNDQVILQEKETYMDIVGGDFFNEERKKTRYWSGIFVARDGGKDAFKSMITSVMSLVKPGELFSESTSASIDGWRCMLNQTKHGFRQAFDEGGKPMMRWVDLNTGDDTKSFNLVRVTDETWPKVEEQLEEVVKEFGLPDGSYRRSGSVAKVHVPVYEYKGDGKDYSGETRFSIDDNSSTTQFSLVEDPALIEAFENAPKRTTYRAMQVRYDKNGEVMLDANGNPQLYPVMRGKYTNEYGEEVWSDPESLGSVIKADTDGRNIKWDTDKSGDLVAYYDLKKGNGDTTGNVRYNSHNHSSDSMMNDQFKQAQSRPNVVVVECEISEDDLNSGYTPEWSKDPTGPTEWKPGNLEGKLNDDVPGRTVFLTQYIKPVRIVPNEEVAEFIEDRLTRGGITEAPSNVFHPEVGRILSERGNVTIIPTNNQGKPVSYEEMLKIQQRDADKAQRAHSNDLFDTAEHIVAENRAREEEKQNIKMQEFLGNDAKVLNLRSGQTPKKGETYDAIVRSAPRMSNASEFESYNNSMRAFADMVGDKGRIVIRGNSETMSREEQQAWIEMTLGGDWVTEGATKDNVGYDDLNTTVIRKLNDRDPFDAARQSSTRFSMTTNEAIVTNLDPTMTVLQRLPGASALSTYDQMLNSRAHQYDEAFTDYARSLHSLEQAVLGTYGLRVDANIDEQIDVYNFENALSSAAFARHVAFSEQYFNPICQRIGNFLKQANKHGAKIKKEDIEKYIYAISGLERNRIFAEREANKALDEQFEKECAELYAEYEDLSKRQGHLSAGEKQHMNFLAGYIGTSTHRTTFENETPPELGGMTRYEDALEEARSRDYSGLTELVDMDGSQRKERDRLFNEEVNELQEQLEDAQNTIETLEQLSSRTPAEEQQLQNAYNTVSELRHYIGSPKHRRRFNRDNRFVEDIESQARDLADRVESYDYTDKDGNSALASLWISINEATKYTLQVNLDSGLIDRDTFDRINNLGMQYYVPLRGFGQNDAGQVYSYQGSMRQGIAPTVKHANGRWTMADSPIANIGAMGERAISTALRNEMKLRLLNLARKYDSDLLTVNDMFLQYNDETQRWEAALPPDPADNAKPTDIQHATQAWVERMKHLCRTNPDRFKNGNGKGASVPFHLSAEQLNGHNVVCLENGKRVVITINGSPRAARVINGQFGKGALEGWSVLPLYEKMMRLQSKMFTSLSPAFIVRNFLRDTATSLQNSSVFHGDAFGQARNLHMMNLASMYRKWSKGKLGNSQEEVYFKEFLENGGETGYVQSMGIEGFRKKAEELYKEMSRTGLNKGMHTVNDYTFKGVMAIVEAMNRVIENTTRFSRYMASRKQGKSITQSIADAKNISVNFNRRGAGNGAKGNGFHKDVEVAGSIFSYIRGTALFVNPAVQGLKYCFFEPLFGKDSNWKTRTKAMGFMAAQMVVPILLGALIHSGGEGDDDKELEEDFWSLPSWDRASNICIPTGKRGKDGKRLFVRLPIGQEQAVLWGIGMTLSDMMYNPNPKTQNEYNLEFAEQIIKALPVNPIEGVSGMKEDARRKIGSMSGRVMTNVALPNFLRFITDIVQNVQWTGSTIYNEDYRRTNQPAHEKYKQGTSPTLIELTKKLYDNTGSGVGYGDNIDISPAVVEYVAQQLFGPIMKEASRVDNVQNAMKDMDTKGFNPDGTNWENLVPVLGSLLKTTDDTGKSIARAREYAISDWHYREVKDNLENRHKGDKEYEKKFLASPEGKWYIEWGKGRKIIGKMFAAHQKKNRVRQTEDDSVLWERQEPIKEKMLTIPNPYREPYNGVLRQE